jgi:ATP-binding cassette subfamily B multidrug efflux pump
MKEILRIISIAFRHKYKLAIAYITTFIAVAAYVVLPRYFGEAIDEIAKLLEGNQSVSSQSIINIAFVILGLSVIRGVISFFQTHLAESISQYVSYDLRNEFYDHIQNQSFAFHDQYHTGNLMSRAITDVENIRMFINMGLVRAPYFISLFIIVAYILIASNLILGLVAVAFMPVVAIYTSKIRLRMRALWLIAQEKMSELSIILQENFAGQRVVKAFASESYEESKFQSKNQEVADIYIKAEQLRISSVSFMLFTFMISMAIVLFFGGQLVIAGNDFTAGDLAEFIFYLQILAMPIRMAGWIVNSYARAASAGERMFEILDIQSEVKETKTPVIPEGNRFKGDIKFKNVSFYFDKNNNVLESINLHVEAGSVIAILGPPGSGKTMLANLLSRFYDPTDGEIQIDDVNIKDYSLKMLRQNIGMVQQDVFLFTTTLKENIAYGFEEATSNEIKNAAMISQMDGFIESLEGGYDTFVGERGSTLSGGQRQRMSIARAVLMDPPILILDDSTSSVDANTEDKIKTQMNAVMQNRTTFVIANRLSTIHNADHIIVLDNGSIIEQGTHKELLNLKGAYRQIYDLQLRPQDQSAENETRVKSS